jgi:hypothetical protein
MQAENPGLKRSGHYAQIVAEVHYFDNSILRIFSFDTTES